MRDKRIYADMGYLPDGQKRLPLNSAEEAQSAWRALCYPGNVLLYTSLQLKRMFGRVVKAFQCYGFPPGFAGAGQVRKVALAVEARLAGLEEYRRVITNAGQPADRQIRHRTGNDDHLELGIYKRPKRGPVRSGPVVRASRS